MAKKQKEAVVEEIKDTTQEQEVKQPENKKTKGDVTKVKVKMKEKAQVIEPTITKVDLTQPQKKEEDAVQKQSTNEVPVRDESKASEKVQEGNDEKTNEEPTGESTSIQDDQPVIEEIIEEEVKEQASDLKQEVEQAVGESEETGAELPENIQKVVDFMNETGGDLQDYVKLNRDYTKDSDMDVLQEYYKQTKPHLTSDEVDFLMEDKFSFNQDEDDEKEIKKKKIALKEQVADARAHLDRQKSKYYEEIKSGAKLTTEQQKAIDFFNRYNKESVETKKTAEANKRTFLSKTDQVFNKNFKGFEYNVGDKKYRFNVNNVNEVKETQSDINNFVKKFLNKQNVIDDAKGYHKSLFTAMNADAVARHFYEQGKADAIKNSVAQAKNINTDARQTHGEVNSGGFKVKVLGESSNDFKFKIKNKR